MTFKSMIILSLALLHGFVSAAIAITKEEIQESMQEPIKDLVRKYKKLLLNETDDEVLSGISASCDNLKKILHPEIDVRKKINQSELKKLDDILNSVLNPLVEKMMKDVFEECCTKRTKQSCLRIDKAFKEELNPTVMDLLKSSFLR